MSLNIKKKRTSKSKAAVKTKTAKANKKSVLRTIAQIAATAAFLISTWYIEDYFKNRRHIRKLLRENNTSGDPSIKLVKIGYTPDMIKELKRFRAQYGIRTGVTDEEFLIHLRKYRPEMFIK